MKVTLIAFGVLALPAICMAEQPVSFNRDVRPILSDRCFHCHGPDEEDRQADLRLDLAGGPDGAYRTLDDSQAIKPGSIEDSAIWYRITSEDDDAMPPPDSSKQPLNDREKDIIRRWIEEGAEYADFWAFLPPRMPALPEVENGQWSQQPIDRFVLRRLEAEGLSPSPGGPAHLDPPAELRPDRPAADPRRRSRRSSPTRRRTPTSGSSIACWPSRSTASTWPSTGSTWCASPTPTACTTTTTAT